ncbi:MAG: SAM-dependent chlorinase/fluorinase, partial [Deltaproteobacteria bacterium]|nr:SAM-dependent chlorinase/fluorinase [Deltaproteobacteria bacterium]
DFGSKDHYVASMKGVILSINPQCTLVDITHEVHPQDVQEGAILLANAFSYFPKGTIHVAVVDPGVGGRRKPILLQTKNYLFVGPDNGLFTLAAKRDGVKQVIHLTHRKYFLPDISNTFHGRDIFAPVAAHLSLAINPRRFGNKLDHWVKLSLKEPEVKGKNLYGKILLIDRFGNLITNIEKEIFFRFIKDQPFQIRVREKIIRDLKRGYDEGKKNDPMALIGSGGFLEISVREGNAQEMLKMKRGDPIKISTKSQIPNPK